MDSSPWILVSEADHEISDDEIVDIGPSDQIQDEIERNTTNKTYSVWISLIRRNPTSSRIQDQLADAIAQRGNDHDAVSVWHDLVHTCPDVPELRARLATAYENINAFGSAAVIWKTLGNHWAGAWEWRARYSMRQKDREMLMSGFVQDRMSMGNQKGKDGVSADKDVEDSTVDTYLEQLVFCRDMFETWLAAKGDDEPNAQDLLLVLRQLQELSCYDWVDADLIAETKIDKVLERFVSLPEFPRENRFRIRNLSFEILSNWGPYLEFNYSRQNTRKTRRDDAVKPSSESENILGINTTLPSETLTPLEEDDEDDEETASTSKNPFEQMYHRPYEITTYITFHEALRVAVSKRQWIMVNIMNPEEFSCHILNRDLWCDEEVQQTIRNHFIFLQYLTDEFDGFIYREAYPYETDPHIGIIDPTSGQILMAWSEVFQPAEFMYELQGFLDIWGSFPPTNQEV